MWEGVMQRAEVQENLRVLLAEYNEVKQRTGCEKHGFIRTYVHASGGQRVKFTATVGVASQ